MIRVILGGLVGSVLLYSIAMIVIRLHMTQMAYQFDQVKEYERSLQEEQLRLRARLAEALSPHHLDLFGLQTPQPSQLRRIP